MKKYFILFIIISLVLYSSVTTLILFIHWNKMDSIVTMNGKLKPPEYKTTFFIVDSYGVPVPYAKLCIDTDSGETYSTTNESGYSDHSIGEHDIWSITVNGKTIYDSQKSIVHWLNWLSKDLIFVIKYDP